MIDKKQAQAKGVKVVVSDETFADRTAATIAQLKQLLPNVITSDNQLDARVLKEVLNIANITSNYQGYALTFAGKEVALAKADSPTNLELKTELAQSKNFDKTNNVVIRGDNIEVLKILGQNYNNKIKMIYIDPPYNTQKEDFVYNDNFKQTEKELIKSLGLNEDVCDFWHNIYGTRSHSSWLTFMYPRLKLAYDLLTDDGVIFISIDDNEQANLKIICDEIFGDDHFAGQIVWQTATDNNPTQIATEHEYVLCYLKNKNSQDFWDIPSEKGPLIQEKYESLKNTHKGDIKLIQSELRKWIRKQSNGDDLSGISHYSYVDEKGVFYPGNSANTKQGGYQYDIIHPVTNNICSKPKYGYRFTFETFSQADKRGDVLWGKDEKSVPKIKKRLDTVTQKLKSCYYEDNRATTAELKNIFSGKKVFNNPKSLNFIKHILKFVTVSDDIILDFFAGSGTTGDAVMRLNAEDGGKRKFIMVQLDEEIKENKSAEAHKFCTDNNFEPVISSITIERLNRAGEKIKKEHIAQNGEILGTLTLDIGYKVFSITDKPQVSEKDIKKGRKLFSVDHPRASAWDTLYNILVANCKPLDTPIETLKKGVLYQADNELYLLGNIGHEKLSEYADKKINLDGWADIDLEQFLNLDVPNKENITVIY